MLGVVKTKKIEVEDWLFLKLLPKNCAVLAKHFPFSLDVARGGAFLHSHFSLSNVGLRLSEFIQIIVNTDS